MSKTNWFIRLMSFLNSQSGEGKPGVVSTDEEEEETQEEGEESQEEGQEEGQESGEEQEEEGEIEDGTGDDGSGKNVGKDRSKFIPRERFDKVNAKASRIDRLIELGVLVEDDDGELQVNPEVVNKSTKKKGSEDEDDSNEGFYFKKEEVDEGSWPLVQKINRGFKHYEGLAGQMAFRLVQLQSENAILRDYPEFLQKESPLRKKALDIMKNDPEFKKTYRGNPERGYWAVKRAAELLAGKGTQPKPKQKAKFIIGKGDAGKTAPKVLDFSKMSREDLDKLEKAEHDRLNNIRKIRK